MVQYLSENEPRRRQGREGRERVYKFYGLGTPTNKGSGGYPKCRGINLSESQAKIKELT